MKLLTFTALATAATLVLTPLTGAMADSHKTNPEKERQKLMRSVGKAMKTTVKMLRGELAYDATAAAGAMKTMNEVATRFPTLFPEGSDMENSIMDFDKESDAKPEIWANMDDFKTKAMALKTASGEALTASSGDQAAFAASFGNVGKACKGCHQKYKADKDQ